jgi:DUF3060 family protein
MTAVRTTTARATAVRETTAVSSEASTGGGSGDDVFISGSGNKDSVDCGGKELVVGGAENELTVTNCSKITFWGSDNTVNVQGSPEIIEHASGNKVNKS